MPKLKVKKIKRGKGPVTYPAGHQPAMVVPKGGSSCAKCKYFDGDDCENDNYRKWNNDSGIIPAPADSYCSDWFEPK